MPPVHMCVMPENKIADRRSGSILNFYQSPAEKRAGDCFQLKVQEKRVNFRCVQTDEKSKKIVVTVL